MRILIATVQVPFVWGGAELLAEGLKKALCTRGHEAEIVSIPFKWYPPERILDHMLACRLLDLTESVGVSVDMVIGLKFPAYLIPHPNKVLWILHQHRQAYDLWDHPLGDLIHFPNGVQIQDAIRQADLKFIPQAKKIFTISSNVSKRLKKFCDIDSNPLYHPPHDAECFYCAEPEDYLFFPSRLCHNKRQFLVLEALAQTSHPVRVHFAGTPENPAYMEELEKSTRKLKIQQRVKWLGQVSEEEKRRQYAHSLGVIFPPFDEDYGYVTLEAMLSSKPVVTCQDSGGPLEFVIHGVTGLVVDPNPSSLAKALDTIWKDRVQAKAWGQAGRKHYERLNINWNYVIETMLS